MPLCLIINTQDPLLHIYALYYLKCLLRSAWPQPNKESHFSSRAASAFKASFSSVFLFDSTPSSSTLSILSPYSLPLLSTAVPCGVIFNWLCCGDEPLSFCPLYRYVVKHSKKPCPKYFLGLIHLEACTGLSSKNTLPHTYQIRSP